MGPGDAVALRARRQDHQIDLELRPVGDQVDDLHWAVLEACDDAVLAAKAHRHPRRAHIDLVVRQPQHEARAAHDDLGAIAAG